MSRNCPNCDQRLLDDERRCWHCGLQLEPLAEARADEPHSAAPGPADFSFAVYGGLTIAVILAAIFLTLYLGGQPRLAPADDDLPAGWVLATDEAQSFSVFLPEAWQSFQYPAEQDRVPATVAGSTLYGQALLPLSAFVEDEQILFLSVGSRPSTFLLVASSAVLNRLSPSDVARADLSLEDNGAVTVLEARQIVSHGTSQAHLRVLHGTDETAEAVCRQRFMRREQTALLFALCAFPDALSDQAAQTVLSSIQILRE